MKLTEQEKSDLEDWLLDGYKQQSIAEAFGVSQRVVSYYAGKMGLTYSVGRPRKGVSDGKVHQAHSL